MYDIAAFFFLFQCMVHVVLFPMITLLYVYISTLQSMCAVPSVVVSCTAFLSCFPGMLLRYFMN